MPRRTSRVGGGSDYGEGSYGGFQGQRVAIIFEEDDGFLRGTESELAIGGDVHIGESEFGPGNVVGGIEHAETETRFEETADGAIDVLHGEETILDGVVKHPNSGPQERSVPAFTARAEACASERT